MIIVPHNGKIAVEIVETSQSSGGLFIPDENAKVRKAKVVAVGDDEVTIDGVRDMVYSEGDVIFFNRNVGVPIQVDGHEYYVIHQNDVLVMLLPDEGTVA